MTPGAEANAAGYPQYEAFVQNVGGSDAAVGTTITDVLPSTVSPAAGAQAAWEYAPPGRASQRGDCRALGETVTCVIPYAVSSGASIRVVVPVDVSITAPATVVNEITVEGGGTVASNSFETSVTSEAPTFGNLLGQGPSATVSSEAGAPPLAGAHPFMAVISVGVPSVGFGETWAPLQSMRTVGVELPQGLVINPMATSERCTSTEASQAFATSPPKLCPSASQVGMAYPVIPGFLQHAGIPIYNMVPPPGAAADLEFEIENVAIHILGGLSGSFHITARSQELLTKFRVGEIVLSLWGIPSDERHDRFREGGTSCRMVGIIAGCAIEPSPAPFITMPTSCTEPLAFSATVTSWQGGVATASAPLSDREFNAFEPSGCNTLEFSPTIESKATTSQGESPTGLELKIHQRQGDSIEGRSTAALKDVVVGLPEGVTINPSGADGLSSCSEQQMGYVPDEGKARFSTSPQACPGASKLGTTTVETPILEDELKGGIYLAKPFDNPFDSLLALYLAIEDEKSGIVVKLAGRVDLDPTTGRLTATFAENPELPLEDIDLHFFEGSRAPLTSPLTCGTKTTTSTLTPWSTPEGADSRPSSSFQTIGSCFPSEAAAPTGYSFVAGTESPNSGVSSPFVLRVARKDGSQHLTGIAATLPEGLLAKLVGVPYCSDSAIAQARTREVAGLGEVERREPSCPSGSEVGVANVMAGSGASPISIAGRVYLAGPYREAPLSLAVVTPIVAGPFDLGDVVTRVALFVDEGTAQLRAVADPLPTIRDGIPLDLRSIELKLDRAGFMVNPTSCDASQVSGVATTATGASASLSDRFQVGDCRRLGFKPKISVSFSGAPPRRGGHPKLKTVVRARSGDASIRRATVILPKTEYLDNAHIRTVCTRNQYAAGSCPQGSIYGHVRAWTPLLEKPLEGPVYLRSSDHTLPDLVASLEGQIKIALVGRVDSVHGRVRNTFEAIPDAPLSRFELVMHGRGKGLLVNNTRLCRAKPRATARFIGHNGRSEQVKPFVEVAGCGGRKAKKSGQRRTADRLGAD